MSEKKNEDGKYNIDFSRLLFIPIVMLLGVVPLIVRLAFVDMGPDASKVFYTQQVADFFSHYKSIAIISLAVIMLGIVFLIYEKSKVKWDKEIKAYCILTAIFVVMTIISSLTSQYRDIAIWGIADRSEGMVMIVSYMVIMLYTIYIVREQSDYKYIILPLVFLIVITGILGFAQYIGNDLLLNTELGKQIIVPEQHAQVRESLNAQYEKQRIYGTMYHYNYMGSFCAMMVPMFLSMTLFVSGYKRKILFGSIAIVSTLLLFGSTSRAGLIGLGCSLIVLAIICTRRILKHYKWTLMVLVISAILVVGVNTATKGAVFSRIPSLVDDAIGLFLPSDESFDYKQHIPVRELYRQGDEIVLETQEDKLHIQSLEGELIFNDGNNERVEAERQEKVYKEGSYKEITYKLVDPRFSQISFLTKVREAEGEIDYTFIYYGTESIAAMMFDEIEGTKLLDRGLLGEVEFNDVEAIGFKGKERLGSARGYIWSRSLPMMKETLILGNGPDTYALEFPQHDLFGKWYAYTIPNMVVDKPHNLYLQIGINQGGVALVAFLALVILYMVKSFRLYASKERYNEMEVMGSALLVAVVGYLGAGIFNDSVVSVAPIFWILLGVGIATNYLVKKENTRVMKASEHAVINMKNKKRKVMK